MIRKHENAVSIKAGILAIAMHAVLFVAMILSINWKAAHAPMQVTEVELWDKLPAKSLPKPVIITPTPEPTPEVKEEPKPEPKPIIQEKPNEETPKVDIALEKKKELQQKAIEEKRKKEEATKKLAEEMRLDALRQEKADAKKQDDKLKKLQQEMLSDDSGRDEKKASTANPSLVAEFQSKIAAKIRGNVNKALCGGGDITLLFKIDILPTGDLSGNPKLSKSSGNSTCDDAVERAIMASQPLPLPTDTAAKAQFRNLTLKFRPNEE
ncbi:MAG TPA: protein TolA [Methylophilaceae bacterium]|nr:protein TolA [Methylophilaceae bacterium]HAJ72700.1 protein TolA [Methylophilaceae bacterium]